MSRIDRRGATLCFGTRRLRIRRVTVPDHKETAKGTLRAILRQVGLTAEELVKLLG